MMPLPILNSKSEPSHSDLIRLFHKTENLWAEHLASAEALDVGTAYSNPELSDVWDANTIRDVALPEDLAAEDALAQVEEHYAAKGTKCFYWTFNPSAPEQRTRPLIELLLARGYEEFGNDVMAMHQAPIRSAEPIAGVKIIPAPARFGNARQILQEAGERFKNPQLIEAHMLH